MANVETLFWADGDTDWGEEFRTLIRAINNELTSTTTKANTPASQIGNGVIALAQLTASVQASLAKADASLNQAAIDNRARAMITEWVGAAPGALDTLLELASRIETEATDLDAVQAAVTTITSGKADKASPTFTGLATLANVKVTGTLDLPAGSIELADVWGAVSALSERLRFRDAWQTGVGYSVNDVVIHGGVYYRIRVAHTSSGSGPTVATSSPTAPTANYEVMGGGGSGSGVQANRVEGLILQNSDGTWPATIPSDMTTMPRIVWERTVVGTTNDPAAMRDLDRVRETR